MGQQVAQLHDIYDDDDDIVLGKPFLNSVFICVPIRVYTHKYV